MKTCKVCKVEKPFTEFHKHADGYRAQCKPCRAFDRSKYGNGKRGEYKHDPVKDRARKYKNRYGITVEQFDEMVRLQGGRCAICRQGPASNVDHCHVTGKVRGLLCGSCNRGLGHFDDDSGVLQAAINYLEA